MRSPRRTGPYAADVDLRAPDAPRRAFSPATARIVDATVSAALTAGAFAALAGLHYSGPVVLASRAVPAPLPPWRTGAPRTRRRHPHRGDGEHDLPAHDASIRSERSWRWHSC